MKKQPPSAAPRPRLHVPPAKRWSPPRKNAPRRRPPCRHCGHPAAVNKHGATEKRGLCRPCYFTPAIRDHYPTQSAKGRRSIDSMRQRPPLPDPTHALPGSAWKVAVMEQRARLGQLLFHPDDAR